MGKSINKERTFIKHGLTDEKMVLAGATAFFQKIKNTNVSDEKVKVLSTDGKNHIGSKLETLTLLK